MSAAPAPQTAGALLRSWRNQRGVSQLRLAVEADVSSRHISFIETGRSRPSREMIVQLSETLEIPLRERNRILEAAGYASLYRQTALDDPSMSHIGRVIDIVLENQHPAGAAAMDWSWNLIKANRSMLATMACLLPASLLGERPLNVMRVLFAEEGLHRHTLNWDEVAPMIIARIRRDAEYEGKPEAAELLDELLASPAVRTEWRRAGSDAPAALLIPLHLRKDDVELRLFSTITTLGTPQDITLQELRIETFYPMDPASEATLRRLSGDPG